MKILKFGGSSVADAKNIKQVINIIAGSSKKYGDAVVVVSALGNVTDNLIRLARLAAKGNTFQSLLKDIVQQHNQVMTRLIEPKSRPKVLAGAKEKYAELGETLKGVFLLKELSSRSLDKIMSFGEQLSAYIVSEAIKNQHIDCIFVDSRNLIKTDDNFGSANVKMPETYRLIEACFKNRPGLSIMGGFIASTEVGTTTTLGRGGSDYTASLVGAALRAESIEIWTDVDGVMTADPRKVASAFYLPQISYEEAGELAHFGAKVIHPKTMEPARLRNIPIDIKNTFSPDSPGTRISNGRLPEAGTEAAKQEFPITAISSLGDVVLLRVQSNNSQDISEIASRTFDTLARCDTETLLTTQSSHEQALSIAVHNRQARKAKTAIEKTFALELRAEQMSPILLEQDLSIVAIVGQQMKGVPGIGGRLFSALGNSRINVVAVAQGGSELNISVVVSSKDETRALQAIHETFFGSSQELIHLFLVGAGSIGSTVLRHIRESGAAVRLCGLVNSRQMLLNSHGLALRGWKLKLDSGQATKLPDFVSQMMEWRLPNSVFVDCSANETVASLYERILKAGIAVVTPNKRANSGPLERYQNLRELAQAHHAPYLYETTVGAGLPVIHTIKSLVASGDEVLRIEAVLSGTLSYIFNTFSESDDSFSQVVQEAQAKGYTEPDPRDDLNGLDAARKILILARELGLSMELGQVEIGPILPEACFKGSVDNFFTELENQDGSFEKRKIKALKNRKVLRYIATLDSGQARLALREVGQDHPFCHLSGSDNMVCITTRRYLGTPLVIQGPGAGAEVTAGGVLADIMSTIERGSR